MFCCCELLLSALAQHVAVTLLGYRYILSSVRPLLTLMWHAEPFCIRPILLDQPLARCTLARYRHAVYPSTLLPMQDVPQCDSLDSCFAFLIATAILIASSQCALHGQSVGSTHTFTSSNGINEHTYDRCMLSKCHASAHLLHSVCNTGHLHCCLLP